MKDGLIVIFSSPLLVVFPLLRPWSKTQLQCCRSYANGGCSTVHHHHSFTTPNYNNNNIAADGTGRQEGSSATASAEDAAASETHPHRPHPTHPPLDIAHTHHHYPRHPFAHPGSTHMHAHHHGVLHQDHLTVGSHVTHDDAAQHDQVVVPSLSRSDSLLSAPVTNHWMHLSDFVQQGRGPSLQASLGSRQLQSLPTTTSHQHQQSGLFPPFPSSPVASGDPAAKTSLSRSSDTSVATPSTHDNYPTRQSSKEVSVSSHERMQSSSTVPLDKEAERLFRCQWAGCSDTFKRREELVGHVTVAHLLTAEATLPPTPFDFAPATLQGAVNSAVPANASTASNLQSAESSVPIEPPVRCLWDSCETALISEQACDTSHTSHIGTGVGTFPSCSTHPLLPELLPDASTATLVRHLLQDHLHLPDNLLCHITPQISHAPTSTRESSLATTSAMPGGSSSLADPSKHSSSPSATSSSLTTPPASRAGSALPLQTPLSVNNLDSTTFQPFWPLGHSRGGSPLSVLEADSSLGIAYDTKTGQDGGDSDPEEDGKGTHQCQWRSCSQVFASTAALVEHISNDHLGSGKSEYFCQWNGCKRANDGRGFNQRQKLLRHIRTHVGDKPYVCSECGRSFSESTTLVQVGSACGAAAYRSAIGVFRVRLIHRSCSLSTRVLIPTRSLSLVQSLAAANRLRSNLP